MAKANKDGWVRHRGGKCPVDSVSFVEIRHRNGLKKKGMADDFNWKHYGFAEEVMAYRFVNDFDILMSKTEDLIDDLHSLEKMPAAKYFDSPIQWRDRIAELDASRAEIGAEYKRKTAEIDQERASLVAKLAAEGFALIERKADPAEDMSDWRNWKAGDVLLCTFSDCESIYTVGKTYLVKRVDIDAPVVFDDLGGDSACLIEFDGSVDFQWHSRPNS